MIKKIISNIYAWFVTPIPYDEEKENALEQERKKKYEQADTIKANIFYLIREINNAEHHWQFTVVDIEIELFKARYKGVGDFDYIIKELESHLSERQDAVQALWSIE